MKKLLIALLVASGVAYAADDCSGPAQKVVDKLHSHNKNVVQLNYSSDQTAKVAQCQSAIAALDKNIVVKTNQVSGTGVFKFEKPDQ